MPQELVSIIIPTYNRELELYNAIESVVNQTYKNIELIVIDDNAKNIQLRNRIEKHIKNRYPNVLLLSNHENLGGAKSRNIGILHANGKYIAFLDDDDVFYLNKIEKCMFDNSIKGDFDFIYSGCIAKDYVTNKILYIYNKKQPKNMLFSHMCSNICATSQMIIKKNILEQVNGFPNVSAKQDYLLILNILLLPEIKVYKTDEVLSIYYEHSNGRISSASKKRINAEIHSFNETKKYFNYLNKKQMRIVEIEHLKKIFNIAYLMKDDKLMKQYLKLILYKKNIYIKGILKYIKFKMI